MNDEIDSTSEYIARINTLEHDLVRFSVRCSRLEADLKERDAEIARLKTSSLEKATPNSDGTYPYAVFVSRVHVKLVDTNSWQTEFCRQTGLSRGLFSKWRVSGRVPAAVFALLEELQPAVKRDRRGWHDEELKELKSRLAKGERYSDIASAINNNWGRQFTTNAITGMADRLKKKGQGNA
jgi:hypothetical protein